MYFFKKKVDNQKNDDEKEQNNLPKKIAVNIDIQKAVESSVENANKMFTKPETYTGNRNYYDSGSSKINRKQEVFANQKIVTDPYTGKKLELKKKDAKINYGAEWTDHLAEADHTVPLEKIHNYYKNDPWLTTDDIKKVANSTDNLQIVSRKFNNAKRNKTQKEFVSDTEYLNKTNIELSDSAKEKAILDSEMAIERMNSQLKSIARKNKIETCHVAGLSGAKNAAGTAATISGISNIVDLIQGNKSTEDALKNVIQDSGSAAVSGYVNTAGLTAINHTLTSSSSSFLKALGNNNIPGKILTIVNVTGETTYKYAKGEITTEECIQQLAGNGISFFGSCKGAVIGQTTIPIPIVGSAVGAFIGGTLCSQFYDSILKNMEYENEQQRIETEKYIQQMVNEAVKRYEQQKKEQELQFKEKIYTVYNSISTVADVYNTINMLIGTDTFSHLKRNMEWKEFEHQDRERRIAEATLIAIQMKNYQLELEEYLNSYFSDYKNCFDSALKLISSSLENKDANKTIEGANMITQKLGGKVEFNNIDEFNNLVEKKT